eukprot:CAMPEP_0197050974 /NCGR_PEP_ID=MMETSP1384-20130603/25755_1 /TAXON_ID=29189 /ORGANISM="Ammonia sp." /LENGTH=55 /DNA_ID=CAMNT_0042483461 /DNA_START=133 /DNA_END=297 /DNA_ORIENTATION=-
MATTTSLSDGEDSTASDVERDLLQNVMAMSLQPDTSHISTASDEIHKQTGGTCYA